MSGKLKNLTRTALTFNLTTKVAPVRALFDRRQEFRDGTSKLVTRRVVFPGSVTVLAGRVSESLPDGVPYCPEVAKAISAGKVRWDEDPPVAAPAPAAEEQPGSVEVSVEVSETVEPRERRRARG